MWRVLVILLLLVVVGGGGLGFYLGWFDLSTRNPQTGKTAIELNIDQTKMKEDIQKAREKVTSPDQKARNQTNGQ